MSAWEYSYCQNCRQTIHRAHGSDDFWKHSDGTQKCYLLATPDGTLHYGFDL